MANMLRLFWLVLIISVVATGQYMDAYSRITKERIFTDALLGDVLSRMNKDTSNSMVNYFDLDADLPKDLDVVLRSPVQQAPEDYEFPNIYAQALNPTLRDQEYLQHSSLWGHQFMPSDISEDPKMLPPMLKADVSLPAYCNPPNPCPNGYDDSHGCIMEFDNTAVYSREYQAAQDCTCDNEHMFDCARQDSNSGGGSSGDSNREMTSTMERFLMHQFQNNNALENSNPRGGAVKKLYQFSQSPFLHGDILPIAAKKGFHIKM